MKKILFIVTLALTYIGVNAQTNLVGRVYYNENIMSNEINDMLKDIDKEMAESKAKAIEEAEKKKGRKLTTEEIAKIDKEMKEAKELANAMKKGMKVSITITFKDENIMTAKIKMNVSDDILKAAGVSWAKRKAIKLATSISPTEKTNYFVKDNLIICDDGKEKDTLKISNDGKYLYGKFEKNQPFTLTRTQ
ncbi:MAG: hypothetical protein J6Y39_06000 [Bacteroidaceae bacterium]|nr:hypothetical protein [Bacteroidaceae bacterium]